MKSRKQIVKLRKGRYGEIYVMVGNKRLPKFIGIAKEDKEAMEYMNEYGVGIVTPWRSFLTLLHEELSKDEIEAKLGDYVGHDCYEALLANKKAYNNLIKYLRSLYDDEKK